ncbi:MAG: MipA/OmpV family protein [Woeseiaceae bacterium]|nr:MipA/OmpV family protein [Woeseiaceae bacterium]
MTHRLRLAARLVLLVTLLTSKNTMAGALLDYLRDYDLNDYALGITISGSQSPYVGGETSAIAYPVLTSFHDSAFTDDWLLIREGDIGIRYVTENQWEFGIIGRVQTLGLGTSDSPRLIGLDDRKWGLETGPMIGYRGRPVHINVKAYTEIMGHHDGLISQLQFSLPREFERGYLVPGIEFILQGEDYVNYYFGVSETETEPLRPEYRAGAALNTSLIVRWGYEISDKWLLYGNLGLEFLDSEIKDSPIVDKDELWSASISVAYNNDIFQPRIFPTDIPLQPRFELRIGVFNDHINSKIVRDSSAGIVGTDIDLENLLGLPDQETVTHMEAIFRVGRYHRFEIGYLESSRKGTATLPFDVTFGEARFVANTTTQSEFDTSILRIGYAYSLINDSQKEFGVMGGLHFSRFETTISEVSTNQQATSNAATPLPVVGLHGSVALGKKSSLGAKVQFFRMDFDRWEGYLNYATLELQRQMGDALNVGLAYHYYALNLDSRDNDVRGSLEVTHHGPVVFVGAVF